MPGALRVPDAAVKYILLQRTAYIRLPVSRVDAFLQRVFRRPLTTPLYNLATTLESRFARTRTKELYSQDIDDEYQTIRQVLPAACARVLDIGCGVAGIDALIQRHYGGEPLEFYLLDKSEVDRSVFYSYQPRGAFYNSLEVAKTMLTQNGIAPERVHLLEATADNDIPIAGRIDLIISLLSWGFHFPVATYLSKVHELLADEGVLVLDVRKGTDGLKALKGAFARTQVILSTPKYDRVAARKTP
jgi:SAM-dependent methyltransferase